MRSERGSILTAINLSCYLIVFGFIGFFMAACSLCARSFSPFCLDQICMNASRSDFRRAAKIVSNSRARTLFIPSSTDEHPTTQTSQTLCGGNNFLPTPRRRSRKAGVLFVAGPPASNSGNAQIIYLFQGWCTRSILKQSRQSINV